MAADYDTSTGFRALKGDSLVADIDAGFLALAQDIKSILLPSGKSIIATSETPVLGGTYGVSTTPDRVSGIVVPTGGALEVEFSAIWKVGGVGSINAAIFVGSNQLMSMVDSGAPVVQEVAGPTGGFGWLYTGASGLAVTTEVSGDATSVTTGMVRGQPIRIDVAAGTYTVEIRYKGTPTVKERNLRVRAITF